VEEAREVYDLGIPELFYLAFPKMGHRSNRRVARLRHCPKAATAVKKGGARFIVIADTRV